MKTLIKILVILAFLALMLFIPAVPVLRGASLANPEAEMINFSLVNLLDQWIFRSEAFGWTIFWKWYSSLGLSLVLAIMAAFSVLLWRWRSR